MINRYYQGFSTPVAVIVSAVIIALALMFVGRGDNPTPANLPGRHSNLAAAGAGAAGFRLPDESDHTRGQANASVAIVEFSDLECPFCARLHPTLKRVVEEDEDVKWIYRHFPLSTIHSRALSAAGASECVARLAGNEAFWTFTDLAFSNQTRLGDRWYKEQADALGIESESFSRCLSDRQIAEQVEIDADEAVSTGGRGTPFVVIVTPDNELIPFSGALPYEQVKDLINQAKNS